MDDVPAGRPRLNLKPRDDAAAAKLASGTGAAKSNPFGAAKPREAVLAQRTGVKEEDILKADAAKDKLQLRLEKDQRIAKEEAEGAVESARADLAEAEKGGDADALAAAKADLKAKEASLEELLDGFQKIAIEKAKAGDAIRPSERRRIAEEQDAIYGGGPPAGEGRGGAPGGGDYGSSFGGRDFRDGGGRRGAGGAGGEDYGNFGGGGGGGRGYEGGGGGGGGYGGGQDRY